MNNLIMCIDNRSFIEKLFQTYIPTGLLFIFEFIIPLTLIIIFILLIIDIISDILTGKINKKLVNKLIKAILCLVIAISLFIICREIGKWYVGSLNKSCWIKKWGS